MKEAMVLIGVLALAGAGIYFGPDMREHFGKRYADADRNIHQQSLSYVRGTIENTERYKLQYELSENEHHRAALRQMVLTGVATVDTTLLPPHLQVWINQLRSNK